MEQKTTVIAKTPASVIARNEAISELCQSGSRINVQRRLAFLFPVALCLLFPVSGSSQAKDTLHKDNSVVLNFHDTRSLPNPIKPLIVLDGVPYLGIPNPNDIKRVDLLTGRAATALYGSQAALGVIFVTTKNSKGYYKRDPEKTEDLFVDTNALYIIDGKVSSNKLNGIDLQNILSVNILKYAAQDPSLNQGVNSEVLVVTKQGAIEVYQKKFRAISNEYKQYIEAHSGDSQVIYMINGVQVSGNTDEKIRSLYSLKADSIKNIVFTSTLGQDSVPIPVVAIATK